MEKNLTQLLGVPVGIERVTFSLRTLTLHGVSLKRSPTHTQESAVPLRLQRLHLSTEGLRRGILKSLSVTGLTFSVGGAAVAAQGNLILRESPGAEPQWEGEFTLQHPALKGWVELHGPMSRPILLGWIEFPVGSRRHFLTQWEIHPQAVKLRQLQIQGDWIAAAGVSWEGLPPWRAWADLSSGQTRLDLQADWQVVGSQLKVKARLFKDQIAVAGEVGLKPGAANELEVEFKGVSTRELYQWLLPPGRSPSFSGEVFGLLKLRGPWNRVESQAELTSSQGKLGLERYTSAALRFSGAGPILQIRDTQINRPSGILLFEGRVDLRKLGAPDFFSQVKLSPLAKSLAWEGWQVKPIAEGRAGSKESSGLKAEKVASSEGVSVNLSYQVDEGVAHEPVARQGVEVGVNLSGQERVNLRLEKEEGFLGVEHKEKF